MLISDAGTWLAGKGQTGEAVKFAVRTGYRHIDCASIYENGIVSVAF